MTMMTLARKASKATLTPLGWPTRRRRGDVVVLLYHRVGPGGSEIELPVECFERQMRGSGRRGARAHARRRPCRRSGRRRAWSRSTTGTATSTNGAAAARRSTGCRPSSTWRPGSSRTAHGPSPDALTWTQLREAVDTGLVTVGSHTHGHTDLSRASEAEAEAEMRRSKELIEDRLGTACEHFAYPWAVGGVAADRAARRLFRTAALDAWRTNRAGRIDPLSARARARSCGATDASSSAARSVGSSTRRPGSTARSVADHGGGHERALGSRTSRRSTSRLRFLLLPQLCRAARRRASTSRRSARRDRGSPRSRPRASGTSRGATRRGRGIRARTPSRSASCSRSSGASASTWCTPTTRSPA